MRYTTIASLLTLLGSFNLLENAASAQQELFQQPQTSSIQTTSGMLLGVYANASPEGLKIVGTIPGYSAEGRLFAGDVLKQVTASGMPVFPIRSHNEIEHAKSQIGPFREAAVEFFRPGVGLMYAWVTFKPIGGGDTQPHGQNPRPAVQNPFPANGPFASGGPRPGTNPIPFNPNNNAPHSFHPNNVNPNNVALKSEFENPNNAAPRSPGPALNPNNDAPMSGFFNPSPNNTQPRSGNLAQSGISNRRFQAEFRLESEKPGARLLFKNPGPGTSTLPNPPFTGGRTIPQSGGPVNGFNPGGFSTNAIPQTTQPQSSGPFQSRVQEFRRQRSFGN